jgi:hypothetical protein
VESTDRPANRACQRLFNPRLDHPDSVVSLPSNLAVRPRPFTSGFPGKFHRSTPFQQQPGLVKLLGLNPATSHFEHIGQCLILRDWHNLGLAGGYVGATDPPVQPRPCFGESRPSCRTPPHRVSEEPGRCSMVSPSGCIIGVQLRVSAETASTNAARMVFRKTKRKRCPSDPWTRHAWQNSRPRPSCILACERIARAVPHCCRSFPKESSGLRLVLPT